jgi:hypothetical protein
VSTLAKGASTGLAALNGAGVEVPMRIVERVVWKASGSVEISSTPPHQQDPLFRQAQSFEFACQACKTDRQTERVYIGVIRSSQLWAKIFLSYFEIWRVLFTRIPQNYEAFLVQMTC